MILAKPKSVGAMKIDLTGPDGNAVYLMGVARSLGGAMGKDVDSIIARMRSGDYENLINVFDEEFGGVVILYREPEDI